jgi:hypothetical protein
MRVTLVGAAASAPPAAALLFRVALAAQAPGMALACTAQ